MPAYDGGKCVDQPRPMCGVGFVCFSPVEQPCVMWRCCNRVILSTGIVSVSLVSATAMNHMQCCLRALMSKCSVIASAIPEHLDRKQHQAIWAFTCAGGHHACQLTSSQDGANYNQYRRNQDCRLQNKLDVSTAWATLDNAHCRLLINQGKIINFEDPLYTAVPRRLNTPCEHSSSA